MFIPIDEVYANDAGTLIVTRFYGRGSLKDHIYQVMIKIKKITS